MAGQKLTGTSTESFEEASLKAADEWEQPRGADRMFEAVVTEMRLEAGGIAGKPMTYIVTLTTSD